MTIDPAIAVHFKPDREVVIRVREAKQIIESEIYNDFIKMVTTTPLREGVDTYFGEKFVYELKEIRHKKKRIEIYFDVILRSTIGYKRPTRVGVVIVEVKKS